MPQLTIADVVQQIQSKLPAVDPARTADVFHAGDPSAPVLGVVVTFQATRAVCDEAIRRGANLIITHEPTFYVDGPGLEGDPVVDAKRKFIADSKLAIWRSHDGMHRHRPDLIVTGMARELGWLDLTADDDARVFELPEPTTLLDLLGYVRSRLKIEGLRYVGDPATMVSTVALSVGCPGWGTPRSLLRREGVDVVLCGETREWETNEYVRDHNASVPASRRQALVVLGHRNSEEAGMRYFADWIRPQFDGLPITFVPAGDPFNHA